MVSHATTGLPDPDLTVDFAGRRGRLFWLAVKTGFLTILTLGFYRFWMKTRMRRFYWSAIRPGGHPMEYVGDPFEKLLGFFIAVVILTFYIGVVNLVLMFAAFAIFNGNTLAYIASGFGVVPIWFYARYRARRYVLGRTRWRGVRFALEPGAWGYALQAMKHWVITILSLGTLWPRMTFALEKYKTDRTFFGDARLHQGGNWKMLYPAAIPAAASIALFAVTTAWVAWFDPVFGDGFLRALMDEDDMAMANYFMAANAPERLWLFLFAAIALIFSLLYYGAKTRQIMANHKTAPGIRVASRLSAPRIAATYMIGSTVAYLILVIGIVVMVLFAAALYGFDDFLRSIDPDTGLPDLGLPRWLGVTVLVVFYFGVFLSWNVMHNLLVTFPVMKHMAATTSLVEDDGLQRISQRARDEFAEAEGFAEALDLGAAI